MDTFLDTDKNCLLEISFAPLQGYTDMAYITSHSALIGGVDFYYTPYFSVEDNLATTVITIPERIFHRIIPQVLPATITELKVLMDFVIRNKFSSINLNLGCPYPMVTRKGRGAYLIHEAKTVVDLIDYIHDHSSLKVSLKTRLGLTQETTILHLLDKIAGKDIESVIVHPRTASQLYKGNVSIPMFQKCRELFPDIDFIYNGDIIDLNIFKELQDLFICQKKWMIGRGLLSNPLLAGQIKGTMNKFEQNSLLRKFTFKLIEEIEVDSKDKGHALNRLKVQFQYFSNAFPDPARIYRIVKKIKTINDLEEFINKEFSS